MKDIVKVFGSIKLSLVLFLLFAFFSGFATFIESKFDTPTAWRLVYANFYFGFIQLLLGINLLCAIFRYKIYRKIALLTFHISFLFILFGSGMTRYFGIEGSLHIRENTQNSIVSTSQSYVVLSDEKNKAYKQSYLSVVGFNDLDLSLDKDGKKANLKYKDIILHAKKDYEANSGDSDVIRFLADKNGQKINFDILSNDYVSLGDVFITFNKKISMPIKTISIDDDYTLTANFDINYLDINDNKNKVLLKNTPINLNEARVVFNLDGYTLRAYDFIKKAKVVYVKSDDEKLPNAILFELEYNNIKKDLYVFENERAVDVILGDDKFSVSYGAVDFKLPFEVHLDKFELLRYTSSNSPKSYKSYITIYDKDKEIKEEIYMNNTLDYGGFRFFQSSYDKDEKGTILSVNKDPGKIPTYIGYFLLTLGLVLNLCDKNSRFLYLARKLSSVSLVFMSLIFATSLRADESALESIKATFKDYTPQKYENVSKEEHFKHLSKLLVQMPNSRIAPLDTLARDLVEKVHKGSSFEGMNHLELFMQMIIGFDKLKSKEFIYLTNKDIKAKYNLGAGKYVSFDSFFDENGYKLRKEVEYASRKAPNKRNLYEKELLKLDERINIINSASMGFYFKVFGINSSSPWLSSYDFMGYDDKDISTQVYVLSFNYFDALDKAYKSGDFSLANNAIDLINYYQHKNVGYKIDDLKIKSEIFFNNAKIFANLMKVYLLAGIILLVLVFMRLLNFKVKLDMLNKIFMLVLVLAFIVHTLGLLLRWYISGHAPWSNSYESMVYISWAITLSGIIFAKKSHIALALSTILSGIMLFGAILAELDPQITNLVPVLQSYWLSIHVSVITASYGFFGLCALLGIFVLVLFCMPKKYHKNIANSIKEATYINEMAMILGLSLLVVGNFFGAIWANESWGRYWGWDSKETWALVSILIYSFIVHVRLVKSLSNTYVFAVLSAFAYWSIIMTYFGVNYFLTGMHSYAKGDLATVPNLVWIVFIFMIMLSLLAYKNKNLQERL